MSSWRHILSMYFSSSLDSLMYRKRSVTQATSWRPASSGLIPASASASWSGPGAAKQPGIPTLRYICMKFEALFFLSTSSAYIGQRKRFWAISILFLNSQRWCITFVNSMSGESTRLRLRVNWVNTKCDFTSTVSTQNDQHFEYTSEIEEFFNFLVNSQSHLASTYSEHDRKAKSRSAD